MKINQSFQLMLFSLLRKIAFYLIQLNQTALKLWID